MKSVVIFLGGNGPAEFPQNIDSSLIIKTIAADSGIELAQNYNVNVDVLIGDLDSASKESIDLAKNCGTEIIAFDSDKDFTDFELTLEHAIKTEAQHLIVIGGGGLRTDHLLGNISVLLGEQTKNLIVDIYFKNELLKVCREKQSREVVGNIGDTISLVPLNGDAKGVTTTGLKWELDNATLSSSRALGISNVLLTSNATIKISNGAVLIIQQL